MRETHIDPLHMVGVKAVQRDVAIAQQNFDRFMQQLFERYSLDTSKRYLFADDGLISEVPSLAEVKTEVQQVYEKKGRNGNR